MSDIQAIRIWYVPAQKKFPIFFCPRLYTLSRFG